MNILVFGATGMLGSAVIRVLSQKVNWNVFGTISSEESKKYFTPEIADNLLVGCDVLNDDLVEVLERVHPNIVINCISLSKKLLIESDPLKMIPIYALFPHQLAKLCDDIGARMVHISTDGVFSGAKGDYNEDDFADAVDLYGTSKYLGEVHSQHVINIRTSIIGHELNSTNGLLSWFLSQKESCRCFSNVIFSGLPTVILAQIVRDILIPRKDLYGIYHIASKPISKCDLLRLIAEIYKKEIQILSDENPCINRSLNAERFRIATGYNPPDWRSLVRTMHSYQYNNFGEKKRNV